MKANYREKIIEWLEVNVDVFWNEESEMHVQAGNYANCSMVTAARWIRQLTAVGQRWKLVSLSEAPALVRWTIKER